MKHMKCHRIWRIVLFHSLPLILLKKRLNFPRMSFMMNMHGSLSENWTFRVIYCILNCCFLLASLVGGGILPIHFIYICIYISCQKGRWIITFLSKIMRINFDVALLRPTGNRYSFPVSDCSLFVLFNSWTCELKNNLNHYFNLLLFGEGETKCGQDESDAISTSPLNN